MSAITAAAVVAYRTEVEGGHGAPDHRGLLEGHTATCSVHIDSDLYAWLRTTAFHHRTSMTALLIAALTRTQVRDAG